LYRFESKLNLSNVDFRNEEKLRANLTKEIEDIKRKYDEAIEKQEEKMKYELQQIDKLSVEKKLAHENEKQKVRLFCSNHLISSFSNSLSMNTNNSFERLKNNSVKKLMNMKNESKF
jgi:hypothetical protein